LEQINLLPVTGLKYFLLILAQRAGNGTGRAWPWPKVPVVRPLRMQFVRTIMRFKACFQGFYAVIAMYINGLIWSDPNSTPIRLIFSVELATFPTNPE
jgi:hypothetical protein